jgi:hypothetical protein
VADFGLVRMGGATPVTRTGTGMGTPGYWAPEQARGEAADARADLFSLGAVLYAAATGFPPLLGESDARAPDPRGVAPGVPDAAAEVVMRAMAPDRADRYGSAVEMALALRASAGLPLSPVTPLPPTERLPPAETLPPSDPPLRFDIAPASEPEPPLRRRAAPLGAGLALVVVAALAGLGLGSLRDGGTAAADRRGGGVGSIAVPNDWSVERGGDLPGLALARATTARPAPESTERLVMGTTRAAGPTLLPAGLAPNLARRDLVRLGNLRAYRYRRLSLANGDPLTIFVVPTTPAAVQTIACSAPPDRFDAFAQRCEAIAATLRLRGGSEADPLPPMPAYAGAVNRAVKGLNDATPDLRRELAGATTRSGQADAAGEMAAAYSTVAAALDHLDPGPGARGINDALVAKLNAAASAYTALATAARAGAGASYATAGASITRAEGGVRAALVALRQAGYEVAGP